MKCASTHTHTHTHCFEPSCSGDYQHDQDSRPARNRHDRSSVSRLEVGWALVTQHFNQGHMLERVSIRRHVRLKCAQTTALSLLQWSPYIMVRCPSVRIDYLAPKFTYHCHPVTTVHTLRLFYMVLSVTCLAVLPRTTEWTSHASPHALLDIKRIVCASHYTATDI